MNKYLKVFFLFLCLPISSLYCQDVDFYREDITFELCDSSFRIDGFYYFRNLETNPIRTNLLYPFPTDRCYGTVDSVFAFDIAGKKDNLLKLTNKAAAIELIIQPLDTAIINIGYRQALNSSRAEYILTTTQGWGKAFDEAHYKLITDANIVIDKLSFEPDTSYFNSGKIIYTWTKTNFLPDKNFIVDFQLE